MFLVLAVWLLCIVAAGVIGGRKGNPIIGIIAGLLLGPIGVIIAILSGDKHRRPCPSCAEPIQRKAVVCPFCQRTTNFL